LLKAKVLRQRGESMEQHTALINKMKATGSMDEVLSMIPELDKLEDEVGRLSEPLAFKTKGPEQWDFCLAADYSDEWTCVRNPDGSIKAALRSFHICISGGEDNWCGTVTESKAWLRLFETEGWAAYQRGYCKACYARYRPKMGMLTEIHSETDAVYWLFSEYPWEWKDCKWMAVEEKHKDARSPRELFEMIEEVHPHTADGFLRPARADECWYGSHVGVYKVADKALLQSMPIWKWGDMLSFAKAFK